MNGTMLSEAQWQAAHQLAIALVKKDDTDPNELSKIKAYLRAIATREDAGNRFFRYLSTLVAQGQLIGHSKKTVDYYRSIQEACQDVLSPVASDTEAMLQILGWATRLMRYYRGIPIAELDNAATAQAQPAASQRQVAIATLAAQKQYALGDKLEAEIAAISGNKVTYAIEGGAIRLTQKEPKLAGSLAVGDKRLVEVKELREDGAIKKISLS